MSPVGKPMTTDRYGTTKLFGNHVLLVTPLHADRTIDETSLRSLVEYVVGKGVHGILALGSSGEAFAMADAERIAFAELVVDATAGRVPVGVGIAHSAADASILLARQAQQAGADYLFTTGPYYHPHGAEGVYRHVKAIGDATPLPIMVYDGGAGIEFSLPLLKRMAETIPTLFASKLFLPYPPKISQYEEATGGLVQAWAGHDQLNYLMLQYGAKGMTSAASNVLPAEQSAIFEAVRAGEDEKARDLFHSVVGPVNSIAFANVLQYPQCYKQALQWMGIIEHATSKIVMEPIDDVRKRELRAVLERVGILD